MTDARKALESAREALAELAKDLHARAMNEQIVHHWHPKSAEKTLATIDAALASGEQPVAYIERSVLAHLAKDKHATATVCSGLLRAPFGDKVALFTMPTPPAPETRS